MRTATALPVSGWEAQFQLLSATDQDEGLDADQLQQLATAAFMAGHYPASQDAWERAHLLLLERGEAAQACRCLYWLTQSLGEDDVTGTARIGEWLARMQHLIEEADLGPRERTYVQCLLGQHEFGEGRYAKSLALWQEITDVARASSDLDIWVFGAQGVGRTLIKLGRVVEGVALFDEVLVAITSGEVSPMMVGIVFCSCVEGCHDAFDLGRARQWTEAEAQWCESQLGLESFTGSGLLYQSMLLQLEGQWDDALDVVERARRKLSHTRVHWELGVAHYQRAELFRLGHRWLEAEEAYLLASRLGQDPQPGQALLRLAQGQPESALAALEHAVSEAGDVTRRAALLVAHAEVATSGGHHFDAMTSCTELAGLAEQFDSPLLRATASLARGRCVLRAGYPSEALEPLREAQETWQRLGVPYEVARTEALAARAHDAVGDHEGADLHRAAAGAAFEQLGAEDELGGPAASRG